MKPISAFDFYIKVCIWTLFCLILAGICYQIKVVIISVQTSENTSSALQIISTINRLQKRYAAKHRGNFAPNFDELIKAENLEAKLTGANPVVNGYVFTMKVEEPTNQKPAFYSITANPLYCDCKALHFYIDSTLGTIKYTEENRPANAADPSI